jgi:hypothetical protein
MLARKIGRLSLRGKAVALATDRLSKSCVKPRGTCNAGLPQDTILKA